MKKDRIQREKQSNKQTKMEKQVTRFDDIVAAGWVGAYNPTSPENTSKIKQHAKKQRKCVQIKERLKE